MQGDWNAEKGKDALEKCRHMKSDKGLADPAAMTKQMVEDSDVWSLPPLTTLYWRTFEVLTKHPEGGPGIAQMDNTTTGLITF